MSKINIERIKDIVNLTRQLAVDLRNLTFADNFDSTEVEVEIAATSEVRIRHDLQTIPTRYIITSQTGAGQVTKGTTEWDSNFAYLYNNGGSAVTIKVIILK